jgi:hypothetical protein
MQLAFGGQIKIAGKTFRLDALFEKESTQKSGVVKGAATAYMVKLMLDGKIGFNALVDDVDSYANFDLAAFGVTRPTILISKSSTQAKSSVANQVVCSITSEAVTLAGVVASLEAHYTKDSQSRIDKSGATGTTGATVAAKAPGATKGSGSQASYQITLVLKEDVNFSHLIEALPAIENLEFETLALKRSTQIVLARTLQTTGATARRSGGTTMTISGPVGTTIGDMTIEATYTKLMASAGKPATTEYVIEVRADNDMRLEEMFSELGLEDNPFGTSIAALPAAHPYFRITNQPGSLEAGIRQPK